MVSGGIKDTSNDFHHWNRKGVVPDSSLKKQSSFQRIFEPASNVDRKKEDGCMNKLRIERTHKLW